MTDLELKEAYRNLLNDPDFDQLDLELSVPNIFDILRISRMEIRHSNFLAWLLDPNETHRLGKLFLERFLRDLLLTANAEQKHNIEIDEIQKLDYNTVKIKREYPFTDLEGKKKYIDLLIIFDKLVVCIENKIGTQDGKAQLMDYYQFVKEKFVQPNKMYVYLTPTGDDPTDEDAPPDWIPYSYKEKIIPLLERIINVHGKTLISEVYQYISDYLITLKRKLTMSDKANDLARQIYQSHKKLIEFIYENKPNVIAEQLFPIFTKFLAEKGYKLGSKSPRIIRFLTDRLKNIIPKQGKGDWEYKECFLFEIAFDMYKERVVFKVTVSPCDNEKIREILCGALSSIEECKKPKGTKWLVYYQDDLLKIGDKVLELDDENAVSEALETQWEKIKYIIEKVEDALTTEEVESKLLEYKNKETQ